MNTAAAIAKLEPQHCKTCGRSGAVDNKGRIEAHATSTYQVDLSAVIRRGGEMVEAELVAITCPGSGKPSREWAKIKRDLAHKRMIEREEEAKPDILIALDAWLSGDKHSAAFKFDKILAMALAKHKRLFMWPFRAGNKLVRTEAIHDRGSSKYKMDVYCRFCGGLLLPMVSSALGDLDKNRRVVAHTMRCALECMAGLREMKGNDHKGLIDEDRAFA